MANKKTPSNGPDVAEVINIELSMTPDNKPTLNATPITRTP